ncbi:MAG TPA: RluA family pseudouridine synthase [Bacteroidia bacterium]|nr:RluA family pseudouridine synthase [Bacteroidia bacterium]
MQTDSPEIPDEDKEMFEHFHFDVDPGQEPMRIDKFILLKISHGTRTKVQHAIDSGNVLVNTKVTKSSYKVRPNDSISVIFPYPKREIELIPENIPINIVYEDDDLMIVNKNAGLVVHPGVGNFTGTLMNALIYHIGNLPQSKTSENDPFSQLRPGLVHRIDKNTSGLLVIAKNDISLNKLSKAFHNKDVKRRYVALVWGNFKEDEGTVTAHIGRDLKDRKKMAAFPEGNYGRHAVTHYKVLQRYAHVTLIECRLETGRTHQIRVHMAYIGHPIFNDEVYGGNKILKGQAVGRYVQFVENCFAILPRQALHAQTLGFIHPITGKEMMFESELPAEMKEVIEKWEKFSHPNN